LNSIGYTLLLKFVDQAIRKAVVIEAPVFVCHTIYAFIGKALPNTFGSLFFAKANRTPTVCFFF